MLNDHIDIVIPWVDGADPAWLAEKAKYQPDSKSDVGVNRYRDWGTMKYWFRGIEKFAPWINKIHFITWGHLPKWLNTENPKLHIVNHKDYIPEEYLPVFSSHPIELNMHRIEGLSEKFVYFNDDTFLISPVTPETFFQNNLPVDNMVEVVMRFMPGGIDHIIGNDMSIINKHFPKGETIRKNKKQWFSFKAIKPTLKNMYMLPINRFSAFDNQHLPVPLLKSTIEEVWEKEPELMKATSSHKFRNMEDVNQWLFRYWQFVTGKFVQSKKPSGQFFSIGRDNAQIEDTIINKRHKLICLSDDTTTLDFEKESKTIIQLFESILPEKSSYEK